MTLDEAREAIMREWSDRPVEERVDPHAAESFAREAMSRFEFDAPGDRFELVREWLLNSFGMP